MTEVIRYAAKKETSAVFKLMTAPGLSLAELADLGVRRVSVGGALARVAWGAVQDAARQIKDGSFAGLAGAASGKELNGIFDGFRGESLS